MTWREPPPARVAVVVTRFIAGAGGVALRGALPLDPARYRTTIVTGESGPLGAAAEAAGIEVLLEPRLVAPLSPRDDREACARLTRLFRERAFDVVHTHSAKAGAVGRWAAHRAGVPLVVHTYHGFPFHDFQSRARHAAYVAAERRLARVTDEVLAIGTGVASEALRRGLARPDHLRTVTPVVDARTVPRDATTRARARDLLDLPADARVVGTVGRVDFQKAPEHFVDAVGRLPEDVLAVWVGGGPLLHEVRLAVERRHLGQRVRFVGERPDVPDLLPAFDVFAMASRYEGLPCAVVEAMRCGLPVVATAVNSVPDLVVPGETGVLVPAGRPDALASAMHALLDDPRTAARLAAGGQARAGTAYDAQALAEVLDDVYGRGLARGAGTRSAA
jgi:glycosyltransferase involved in cell wall biosynthesis